MNRRDSRIVPIFVAQLDETPAAARRTERSNNDAASHDPEAIAAAQILIFMSRGGFEGDETDTETASCVNGSSGDSTVDVPLSGSPCKAQQELRGVTELEEGPMNESTKSDIN